VLVVGQVALAVVLSVGAGLLARSLLAALRTDPGFRPEQVLVAAIVPSDRANGDIARNAQLMRDVLERLAGVPGVQVAGAVDNMPFDNPDSWSDFYRDDRPVPEPGRLPNGMKAAVSASYFQAMGVPLLSGRLFSPADGRLPPVKRDVREMLARLRSMELTAVINETMARRFWPDEDPVGKYFRWGPPSIKGPRVKIVGIVGDSRQQGLDRPVEPQYFFSMDQFPMFDTRLVVRTSVDPASLAATLRAVVAECDPNASVARIERLETLIGRSLTGRQNSVLLLGGFSGIALLLASLGLYATMAYIVTQRTQEIGLRMALGAAAADVRTMVVREGVLLAAAGVGLGVLAALAGARAVSSMLYGIAPTDPLTYLSSAMLLTAVMVAASYIPARRASRVDPMEALRFD
jgi:putative ABC transport system permease protein